MSRELYIHEIFPSFQGEGILVGVPQVFVRLSGCNLNCSYCDTPASRLHSEKCRLYAWEGWPEEVPNPLGIAQASGLISSRWGPAMHSVSITGGEPLLQAAALEGLMPLLKREGMPVYLETNGTLAEELEVVLPWTDWIAMDVKLPSTQGGEDLSARHRDFLRRAAAEKLFLKMVIDSESGDGEVEETCRGLSEAARGRTLVLQPATPSPGEAVITPRGAFGLYLVARKFFADVRVIPQAHRAWGIR
jgi:7-carboxy-7-deazaguanine synthase